MFARSDIQWQRTADVVVVGYGAAGAVAAITACDRKAQVLILEKQLAQSHISNSSMSVGAFLCPDDVVKAAHYMEHLAKVDEALYWTDRQTLQAWAEYACQNKSWVEEMGAKVSLFAQHGEHDFPGADSMKIYYFQGLGYGMMNFFKHLVEDRNIGVMYETRAQKLIVNNNGDVLGVAVRNKEGTLNIRAQKAVIMTLGGFEYDEEMKLNYLKVSPTYFAGSTANTGDGVRMVQEIGASLWHMNCCSASWVLKFSDFPIAFGPNFGGIQGFAQWRRAAATGSPCGYVFVDQNGRRFTSEHFKRHTVYYELALFDSQKLVYPRVPTYWIFDRRRIEAGPLPLTFYGPLLYRLFPWSRDNKTEIQKGWIVQGNSVAELAGKIGMDPITLKKTVQDYNSYCEHKDDPEFHRPPQHLVPLATAPYFAVKLWPGSANTQGGPRRNCRAQVLDVNNTPISHLYAAGEFGSVYGMLYPAGGGNLGECIAFGRIAGYNAAAETATL